MRLVPLVRWVLMAIGGVTLLVGALAIFVLVVDPTAFYRLATRVVVVDDALERSDFIYVLNGRISSRADHAAQVYHEGWAPRVLLAHTREMARRPDRPLSELIASEIRRRGVPEEAVDVIPYQGGVVDTRDEGRALRRHLERQPAERVIVVTTDHHTGRARRTIRQELRGIEVDLYMSAAPANDGVDPDNWWRTHDGMHLYGLELAKQVGVILHRVGLAP